MDIEIKGLPELYKKLGRLATLEYLVQPMQAGLFRLEARMKEYPQARPSSNYVRTGTLGRRWVATTVKRIAEGLYGSLGNNTPYGPFVESSMFQAYMHRGRWQTDQQVMDEEKEFIVRLFENAVSKAV